MKAVLDTNVFVSILIAPRGAGAWLMALWKDRQFDIVISHALFDELAEVLQRPKVARYVDNQRKLALFCRLQYDAIWTGDSIDASGALPDPEDEFLIAAALEAEAGWLVTWDKTLLAVKTFRLVQIVSPDHFIPVVRNFNTGLDSNSR